MGLLKVKSKGRVWLKIFNLIWCEIFKNYNLNLIIDIYVVIDYLIKSKLHILKLNYY